MKNHSPSHFIMIMSERNFTMKTSYVVPNTQKKLKLENTLLRGRVEAENNCARNLASVVDRG